MSLDLYYIVRIFPQILGYLPVTLFLAIVSMACALVLGLALALLRISGIKVVVKLVALYVSIFRGTPTLVQLFILYFGLPQVSSIFNGVDAFTVATIGFSLKTSAYMAEIYRAGLTSVDFGQMEAGLSIGMRKQQIFCRIIFPQAMLHMLPATGNTFISLIKETSVAFALGVTELFAEGKMIAAESLRYFETFIVVGLIYWFTVITYSRIQMTFEKYLSRSLKR